MNLIIPRSILLKPKVVLVNKTQGSKCIIVSQKWNKFTKPKNNTQTNTIVINGEKGDILHENVLKEICTSILGQNMTIMNNDESDDSSNEIRSLDVDDLEEADEDFSFLSLKQEIEYWKHAIFQIVVHYGMEHKLIIEGGKDLNVVCEELGCLC